MQHSPQPPWHLVTKSFTCHQQGAHLGARASLARGGRPKSKERRSVSAGAGPLPAAAVMSRSAAFACCGTPDPMRRYNSLVLRDTSSSASPSRTAAAPTPTAGPLGKPPAPPTAPTAPVALAPRGSGPASEVPTGPLAEGAPERGRKLRMAVRSESSATMTPSSLACASKKFEWQIWVSTVVTCSSARHVLEWQI